MAVRIRLTRVGMTKQPTYRFVVTDSRNARDGRSLETLGHYNPRTDPVEITVNQDRAKEWLSRGAQPSDVVDRLFRRVGVLPERTDRPTGTARGPKKADKTTKASKRAAAAEAAASAPAAEAAAPAAVDKPTTAEEPTTAEAPAADKSTEVAAEAAAEAQVEAQAEAIEAPAEAPAAEPTETPAETAATAEENA